MLGEVVALVLLLVVAGPTFAERYDLVIEGGRAMDPETGLDAPRNVGISGRTIRRVSADTLQGKRVLHVNGLVVAPGFIDLHQHSQTVDTGRLKAFDGVTTALEMEIGAPDAAAFLRKKAGRSLINYGTSASYVAARARAFGAPLPGEEIIPRSGPATNEPATDEQLRSIEQHLNSELDAGALAIGMGIEYIPGSTRMEVIRVFRVAAARNVPVFTHVRSAGRIEPGSSIEAVSEVIGAAAITGAALHIVHINSSCMKDWRECLSLIEGARVHGITVTTEAYPYVAGLTYIGSALFNPGWKERRGIDYGDVRIPETGEPLTKERFEELRRSPASQAVLIYVNSQETVDNIIADPSIIIASDGEKAHPRNAGTYSRVLARYVRDLHSLTLMHALRKMTLMPAQVLERATPRAARKGRLQEGADADVVVFDPDSVTDHSTFDSPERPSSGMQYVIVDGTVLVDRGKLVPRTFPGRPL